MSRAISLDQEFGGGRGATCSTEISTHESDLSQLEPQTSCGFRDLKADLTCSFPKQYDFQHEAQVSITFQKADRKVHLSGSLTDKSCLLNRCSAIKAYLGIFSLDRGRKKIVRSGTSYTSPTSNLSPADWLSSISHHNSVINSVVQGMSWTI